MESQSEREFTKLQAKPVEVEFKLGTETVKAWLHCLSDTQAIHCIGVYGEQYDICKEDGQDEKWCASMGSIASNFQTLVYCLKVGPEKHSKPVFSRVREAMSMNGEERDSILRTYFDSFDLSEEEVGNLLRARIGSSSTKSSLPALSQVN